MSSSENEEEFYFNTNNEIWGYQWEPEYSETELLEMNQEQLR
jgi:GMP synthase-like glutamine amidotransferase